MKRIIAMHKRCPVRYQANEDPKFNGSDSVEKGRPLILQATLITVWNVAAAGLLQWVHQPRGALWKRVLYLFIYALCFFASAATFVVILLKISRARLASLLTGGAQGIVLSIFSTPFVTRVSVTAVLISRIFRDVQTGNQLDNQTREDIRGLVMDAIEASVIYPAIVLNVLKARSEFSVDQDTIDFVYDVSTAVLAFGWITLWFSGGQNGRTEGTHQGSAVTQSRGDDSVGAMEAGRQEAQRDTSDTFDSFTQGSDMEMATLAVA